jgi:hypothetical protein
MNNVVAVIIAIVLLGVLAVSNPKLEEHQRAMRFKIEKIVDREFGTSSSSSSSSSTLETIASGIGSMLKTSIIDGIVKEYVKRKDYLLFSLTTVEINNEPKIVGIGLLGNVFISEKVDDEVRNGKDAMKKFFKDALKSDDSNNNSNSNSNNNYNSGSNNASNYRVDTIATAQDNSTTYDYNNSNSATGAYYVLGSRSHPVHFYTRPDYNTMRNAYFDTQETVYALSIQNGFAYVEFTNTSNQTSKGWIPLSEMSKVGD